MGYKRKSFDNLMNKVLIYDQRQSKDPEMCHLFLVIPFRSDFAGNTKMISSIDGSCLVRLPKHTYVFD